MAPAPHFLSETFLVSLSLIEVKSNTLPTNKRHAETENKKEKRNTKLQRALSSRGMRSVFHQEFEGPEKGCLPKSKIQL